VISARISLALLGLLECEVKVRQLEACPASPRGKLGRRSILPLGLRDVALRDIEIRHAVCASRDFGSLPLLLKGAALPSLLLAFARRGPRGLCGVSPCRRSPARASSRR